MLAKGLSFYGNATLHSAKYKGSGATLEEAPKWTAATGLIYENKHGPFGSIIGRWIGPRYGNDNGNVAMATGYLNGNVAIRARGKSKMK